MAEELSGLERRLESEPDYRPYCLMCGTMERMTLDTMDGRRVMKCLIAAETGPGAKIKWEMLRIPPSVGCGGVFDIHTGEKLVEPRKPLPGEQYYRSAPGITER